VGTFVGTPQARTAQLCLPGEIQSASPLRQQAAARQIQLGLKFVF